MTYRRRKWYVFEDAEGDDMKHNGVRFMMEGVVVNVMMVSYRRFKKVIPEHAHGENVYEIHLVTEGEGQVFLNKHAHSLTAGSLYFTGPGILHEQIPDEKNPITEFGLYLQLEGEQTGGELLRELRRNAMWCGKCCRMLPSLAEQILVEQTEKRLGGDEKRLHLLADFLIECIRSIDKKEEEQTKLPLPEEEFPVHRIQAENVQLVADEIFLYEYRDITLGELARRLGFSVRQTQRFLERMYGKTFVRKKLEARMSAAIPLLQNSSYTITEISERLGYSSVEHFSHAFSEYYGYVPSSLRKSDIE